MESALVDHPDVVEAAVVGSPDPVRGQIVRAFVVLTENRRRQLKGGGGVSDDDDNDDDDDGRLRTTMEEALVEELKNYVKKLTAPYKYPRKIEFVDALPKTISGKIRRVELRQKSE